MASRHRKSYSSTVQGEAALPIKEGAEAVFLKAQLKHQESVRRLAADIDSSSEEELESNSILDSILSSYSSSGGRHDDLGRTKKFLEEAFQSGSVVCLICIATIRRTDKIWSCIECFCYFHLKCVMKWGAESIYNLKQSLLDLGYDRPKPTMQWSCPNCRHAYLEETLPRRCYCFCLKIEDPPSHPWLIPHSCGDTCGKLLQPTCGHKCLLLCHPGPCPPCPKMVKNSCYCKKQQPQTRRCSNKYWSCNCACGKLLKCGKHSCGRMCHDEDCLPCPETSIQYCECGSLKAERPCSSPEWNCDKVCGKNLSCGNHTCERICHKGECGICPLAKSRACPCGKTVHKLPCTEEVPLCGDTCGRVLECGLHSCPRSCHHDKCGTCLEVISKKCRCGAHVKEQPCRKEYICETKCKRIKSCLRHTCSRKCCDGMCPPCEKLCSRPLACGNHKCTSVCHQGPCYPCVQTVRMMCACRETSQSVPCGVHKRSKPPKCTKPCRKLLECHHENTGSHKCHYGKCPPCREICGLKLEACSHCCQAPCHDVSYLTSSAKKSFPWDMPIDAKETKVCPPCQIPVPATCLGGHETINMPCATSRPFSCGRLCDRVLACGNHKCEQICHVPGGKAVEKAGANCDVCESGCTKPRPEGCTHSCLRPCHPNDCAPCCEIVRLRCYCQINLLHISCSKWTATQEEERRNLQNCGNRCPKNYKCGHRCQSICHPGDCPDEALCQKKVKIYCECRRLRKEVSCDVVRAGSTKMDCDEECEKKKKEQQEASAQKLLQRELEEKRKQEEEMDLFQKKFQGRKKRLKQNKEKEEPTSFMKQYSIYLCSFLLLIFAVYICISI